MAVVHEDRKLSSGTDSNVRGINRKTPSGFASCSSWRVVLIIGQFCNAMRRMSVRSDKQDSLPAIQDL